MAEIKKQFGLSDRISGYRFPEISVTDKELEALKSAIAKLLATGVKVEVPKK